MSDIVLVDLDSVEIVSAIERAFLIKITAVEAKECATVGDVFDVVLRKVPTVDRDAPCCPTASAFWRLSAALRHEHPRRKITPATPLADVVPVVRRRAWWARLRQATDLQIPSARPPKIRPHRIGAVLAVGSFGVALACGARGWSLPIGILAGMLYHYSVANQPEDVIGLGAGATVGDLAKITAALNAGRLAGPTRPMRRRDVMAALEGVLRDFTSYSGPIDKRTRFRVV